MCSLAVVAHQHLRAGSVCGWMLPQTAGGHAAPQPPPLHLGDMGTAPGMQQP